MTFNRSEFYEKIKQVHSKFKTKNYQFEQLVNKECLLNGKKATVLYHNKTVGKIITTNASLEMNWKDIGRILDAGGKFFTI